MIDRPVELRTRRGIALVVLDPLAAFMPGQEGSTVGPVLEELTLLHRCAARLP